MEVSSSSQDDDRGLFLTVESIQSRWNGSAFPPLGSSCWKKNDLAHFYVLRFHCAIPFILGTKKEAKSSSFLSSLGVNLGKSSSVGTLSRMGFEGLPQTSLYLRFLFLFPSIFMRSAQKIVPVQVSLLPFFNTLDQGCTTHKAMKAIFFLSLSAGCSLTDHNSGQQVKEPL